TAPDAIVTVDEASCILSVNPATERIFGWSAEEMVGRNLDMIMPEEYRARHAAGMARYIASGVRRIPWTGVPVHAITKDGRRIPIEISFGEFTHEGRRVFSGFLRDVSDRAAQQAALARTAAELESALETLRQRVVEAEDARRSADAANQAKSQFLATMSHELRTPLNAIGGYVELLESGVRGPVTEPQREDLLRVARAQARLLSLVNDVLNFARIESGRVDYDVRDVPVNPLLCALGPLVDPQVRAKRIVYECDPGPRDVIVCADQQKLEQILLNLLSNAVKFTPEGGTVSVTTDADATSVRMHVRDTGVGIPPDRLEAVFEPFVQVDATLTRVHGGTGLGLAISQELARGMGGNITVRSTLGLGTEFTVTMPSAGACGRRPQNTVGDMLARDARAIVRGMVARLRAEPDLPPVTDAELEDHTASLVTDLAQLLVILDTGGGHDTMLVRDGARIQTVIIELHGRQRRRLGWTASLLSREFDILADEAAQAIRAHAQAGQIQAGEECVDLVRALLDEAKAVGLRSLANG
ncbi:MAG: sensor protein, partial [Gemmatimonadetes bacterium]|nr:sensor protein [Gemmatimonadota bacterium]